MDQLVVFVLFFGAWDNRLNVIGSPVFENDNVERGLAYPECPERENLAMPQCNVCIKRSTTPSTSEHSK